MPETSETGAIAGQTTDAAPAGLTPEDRLELERGLRFAHIMLHVSQKQGIETTAAVQAIMELLVRKGILDQEELKALHGELREQARKDLLPRVRLGEFGDKYEPGRAAEVPCAECIPTCRARCCTFKFYLTKQDLDEHIVCWDYGNPYWIKHREDGYCVHSDPVTHFCTIYEHRPLVCRTFDCREDKRLWLDFERRVPAPEADRNGLIPEGLTEAAVRNSMRAQGEDPSL